jgi:hypothetical protein
MVFRVEGVQPMDGEDTTWLALSTQSREKSLLQVGLLILVFIGSGSEDVDRQVDVSI